MTPVYLIRHAKSRNRLEWTEPDHLRPLTKAGRRQVEALVTLIGEREPVSRLVSSPHVRCVQTLEPLAEAYGLDLETAEELAEGAPVNDALALILSLAVDGPAALRTHGDVMMFAVEELGSTGVPLEGPLEFKKGSTWILDVDRGSVVRGLYLPPPEGSKRVLPRWAPTECPARASRAAPRRRRRSRRSPTTASSPTATRAPSSPGRLDRLALRARVRQPSLFGTCCRTSR